MHRFLQESRSSEAGWRLRGDERVLAGPGSGLEFAYHGGPPLLGNHSCFSSKNPLLGGQGAMRKGENTKSLYSGEWIPS